MRVCLRNSNAKENIFHQTKLTDQINMNAMSVTRHVKKSEKNQQTFEIIKTDSKFLQICCIELSNLEVTKYLNKTSNVSNKGEHSNKKYSLRTRNLKYIYKDESDNSNSSNQSYMKSIKSKQKDIYDFECESNEENFTIKKKFKNQYDSDDSMIYYEKCFKRQQKHKKNTRNHQKKQNYKVSITPTENNAHNLKERLVAELVKPCGKTKSKKINHEESYNIERKQNILTKDITVNIKGHANDTDSEIDNVENVNFIEPSKKSLNNSSVNDINDIVQSFINDNDENKCVTETSNLSPWRSNLPCQNIHRFSVKSSSFMPNYDQDIVINSSMVVSSTPNKNSFELPQQRQQTTLLDFINSKIVNQTNTVLSTKISLVPIQTPRKILGDLNCSYSTSIISNPLNPSPEKEKSPSLFGFSKISDESDAENSPPSLKKRLSPRKKKKNHILLNESKLIENIEKCEKESSEIVPTPADEFVTENDNFDVSVGLFQDFEHNLHVKKQICRSYQWKRSKRVRLRSIDSYCSEDDEEPPKPKTPPKKSARIKQEEKEAQRLASLYNSRFQEIEEHVLCIE